MVSIRPNDRKDRRGPRGIRAVFRALFGASVFELLAAVLLGKALYYFLYATVDSAVIPFLLGLFRARETAYLGYLNLFGSRPTPLEFNGYSLQIGRVFSVFGTLLLAALVVVVVVVYARWEEAKRRAVIGVEMRTCPECLSLIPAAARRCAFCRTQVQPQAQPGDAST
jgi:large conductance mechanosensitive channel